MGRDMHCTNKSMLTMPCPKEILIREGKVHLIVRSIYWHILVYLFLPGGSCLDVLG
jgi:hypothetical protein